ncbi:MAG: hypothetical protein ACR2RV_09050 [Verrucomicrobiales bacterium]
MKSRFLTFSLLLAAALLPSLFVSCASDDPGNYKLEQKLDQKNDRYGNRIDRRSMRRHARDQRYDAWFDMIMQ